MFITLIARFGWSVTLPFLQSNHPTELPFQQYMQLPLPRLRLVQGLVHPPAIRSCGRAAGGEMVDVLGRRGDLDGG